MFEVLQIALVVVGLGFVLAGSKNLIKGYKIDKLISFFIQLNKKTKNIEKRK